MDFLLTYLDALASLVNAETISVMFVSTLLGIIIGAVPGLTATMGLALLIGFTTAMPMEKGLTLLFGIFVGAIYGGSLSAILLNIPGTPSAAATAIDGYALARKGLASRAIVVTRLASVIGTGLSSVCLMLLTPFLAVITLKFQSPEFFMLALFGISICGSITSDDLAVKGWIGGALGVLFSLIGIDDIEGIPRFTLGMHELMSGISIVPVMIGLYAFPQVVKLFSESGKLENDAGEFVSVHGSGIGRIVLKRLDTVFKSAGIGVGIGILPGVGEDVAAWVAYDVAKRTSREKELFGYGSYDGIIAPEVANNAAVGGSLIPMILLGIPGSPPVAVMMGALIFYGIRPGPLLMIEQPNFLSNITALLFMATICLWLSAWLVARPITKILNMPKAYIMPFVAALSFIGAYAINLSRFDMLVVIFFGVVGCLLNAMKYSPAPVALGLILGKMLDIKFRTTLMVSDGSFWPFFSRPISLTFVLFILFFGLYKLKGKRF